MLMIPSAFSSFLPELIQRVLPIQRRADLRKSRLSSTQPTEKGSSADQSRSGFLPRFSSLMWFIVVLFLIAALIPSTNAREQRLCGRKLTKLLQDICKNRLNPPTEAHNADSRIGVATKCCEERCTLQYLQSFCAPEETDY